LEWATIEVGETLTIDHELVLFFQYLQIKYILKMAPK